MIKRKDETDAEFAAREAKHKADLEAHFKKMAENERLAVPLDIERLRQQAKDNLDEAARLEALLLEYPNLRKHTARWNKVSYYSKDINPLATEYEGRFNCGCCSDSSREVFPYLDTANGRVYSDPPKFSIGEKNDYGGATPYLGWDQKMRDAGISEVVIAKIQAQFKDWGEEARENLEYAYEPKSEEDEDEPFI